MAAHAFEGPAFLKDSAHELQKHQDVDSKNLRVISKNYMAFYADLKTKYICRWDVRFKETLTSLQKTKRELALTENKTDKLQTLIDSLAAQCRSLSPKIAEKQDEVLTVSQQIQDEKMRAQHSQSACAALRESISNKYSAILSAKMFYKTWMDFHVSLLPSDNSGDTFVVSFGNFTNNDKENLPHMSLKLFSDSEMKWKLLETNPVIPEFHHFAVKLQSSQDINGFLTYIRNAIRKQ